ncbi:exopolysaccharide biosynthesis polyprenyl glycosylphosphotransferase [Nocardioides thalensis]|uniref:Exopolysaccharide biosynthesis polyprenyl glycosylphosphotransferase n=1 Tax=Nocardioides thalensis TaxID=1914755 RepID=A0A853C736_9ACTN|nr:sugar transferase [Nocardioides thalensis]NYJ02826.1 exopolysaccharide biosynthesis polyprenyl glycosylphosphotransferase [Nocardioides thalensis]
MTAVVGHARRQRAAAVTRSRTLPYLPWIVLLTDAAILAVVTVLASLGEHGIPFLDPDAPVDIATRIAAPSIAVGWLLMLAIGGGYRRQVLGSGSDEYKRVLNATAISTGVLALASFLTGVQISRGFFVGLFTVGLPAVLVGRWGLRKLLHSARRHGYLGLPVLVAGSPDHVDEIHGVLERAQWLGYDVIGAITPEGEGRTPAGVPIVGSTAEATLAALRVDAQVILFTAGAAATGPELQERVWELEERGIGVVVAPGVTGITTDRVSFRPVGGLPLLHLGTPAWAEATRVGKRLFDIVGALGLMVVLSPLFAFVALRIKIHDGGPIFFHQSRVGRQGVPFRCAKFRTMVVDAEERLAELHAATGYDGDGLFKMEQDPRITKPGRWLRKHSVDEMPQLWNVVRGDMSLVGPRPPLPHEVANYDTAARRRLHVRPGMTGLWQVSGRSDLSWEDAVRLDLYYVDNWSMLQDLHILFRTLGAVIFPKGAY